MSPVIFENPTIKFFVENDLVAKRLKNRNTTASCADCDFTSNDFFPRVLSDAQNHDNQTKHEITIRVNGCGFGLL